MELTVVFESEVGDSTLAWEHGMWLLLNACDLEMLVQAVFLCSAEALSQLPESLAKKLQQFDLYDIPSFALESGLKKSQVASKIGEMGNIRNQLDWSWVLAQPSQKIAELLENSQQVISV